MPDKRIAENLEKGAEQIAQIASEGLKEVDAAAAAAEDRRKTVIAEAGERISGVVEDPETHEIGRPLKVFAILSLIVSVGVIVVFALLVYAFATSDKSIAERLADSVSTQALVLNIVALVVNLAQAALFVVFSVRILRNLRRNAALLTSIMLWVSVVNVALALMTTGLITFSTIYATLVFIFLVVMHTCLDPTLADERRLQRKLQDMEFRSDAEKGVLGRDKTGEGYIELNFFNLFWIFVVASFLGLCFEMAVCPFLNGKIENRTGMLFGPFSPIYGIGAALMTIALNRYYKRNPVIVFLIAGLIGAAFEFFVSWFFENAFGILAWDYSGEFLNIAGRTDFFHFLCWGCLGLVFVRWLLPLLLRIVNIIPWNWRYGVTCVCAALMIVNGIMTLMAFDCWYQRKAGIEPDTPVAQFFADNFNDDFMQGRFQNMSIDPNRCTHN